MRRAHDPRAASFVQPLAVGAVGFALLAATLGVAIATLGGAITGDGAGEAGEPEVTFGAVEVAEAPVAEHIVDASSLARLAKFNPVVKC